MSNSDLSDVLVLPQVTQHKRKREAVNSRAKCVTDDDILGELKAKEQEKMEKIQEKEKNKAEIQRRKEEAMKRKRHVRHRCVKQGDKNRGIKLYFSSSKISPLHHQRARLSAQTAVWCMVMMTLPGFNVIAVGCGVT